MRLLLFTGLLALANAEYKRYDGYKLVEVVPHNTKALRTLGAWNGETKLDFWEEPTAVGSPVHVFVSPEELEAIGKVFDYKVLSDSVQEDIDAERARLTARAENPAPFNFNYDDFNTLDAIIDEINALATRCPEGFTCDVYSIGQTYESRDQTVMHISKDGESRDAIWIDATIHSREWLAPATFMKVVQNLIDNYGSDAEATAAMDRFDFYLLPVVNPDGYVHTHTSERLWRKNRTPNDGSSCLGTDLNRNFDFEWSTSGTSANPCSETFHGASAASELEVQNQQAELHRIADSGQTIFAGISMHTYGRYWLMNYGHQALGSCVTSPDYDEQYALCTTVAQATMATHNTNWAYGPMCTTLYPASGNTIDYMYGSVGILYAYLPELRGASFVVDPSQIQPSYEEIWAGLNEIFTHQ
jgi:carboxypeptidase A2